MPIRAPPAVQVATISSAPPRPSASAPSPGQTRSWEVAFITMALAARSVTSVRVATVATTAASASRVPPSADSRRGPWVNTVLQVFQPKPLPVDSAARMTTREPPNIGSPATMVDGTPSSDSWLSRAPATRWSPPLTASR
jgi:hypothetical protein